MSKCFRFVAWESSTAGDSNSGTSPANIHGSDKCSTTAAVCANISSRHSNGHGWYSATVSAAIGTCNCSSDTGSRVGTATNESYSTTKFECCGGCGGCLFRLAPVEYDPSSGGDATGDSYDCTTCACRTATAVFQQSVRRWSPTTNTSGSALFHTTTAVYSFSTFCAWINDRPPRPSSRSL